MISDKNVMMTSVQRVSNMMTLSNSNESFIKFEDVIETLFPIALNDNDESNYKFQMFAKSVSPPIDGDADSGVDETTQGLKDENINGDVQMCDGVR